MRTPGHNFRRALRWYPPKWRSQHGDQLLAMLEERVSAEELTATQIRKEQARMVASGMAERLRFTLPLGAAVATAVVAGVGLWRITSSSPPAGLVLELFIGPVLAVIATVSLVAAVQHRWSPRLIASTVLALAGTLSLSAALWMFALPDEQQLALPLFWGAGIAYLFCASAAASVAMAPLLSRQFSPAVSLLLGFACGLVGAVLLTPVLGNPVATALAGIALGIVTLRQWRQLNSRATTASI